MSRKNHTKVKQSAFLAIAEKHGLSVLTKKGEVKVFVDSKKRSMGIPATADVTRIELVGFEHEVGINHPKPPAKTVTQMLDFTKTEPEILHDFVVVAKHLVKLAKEDAKAAQEAEEAKAAEVVEEKVAVSA
jgi:hypothetical protein